MLICTSTFEGGNGLGLFISRRLAELQGGAIGFSSKAGGSIFSFYVKGRRSMIETPRSRISTRKRSEYSEEGGEEPQQQSTRRRSLAPIALVPEAPAVPSPPKLYVLVVEGKNYLESALQVYTKPS
jgi:hypothetical protein